MNAFCFSTPACFAFFSMDSVLCAYIEVWERRLQEAERQNVPEEQLKMIRFTLHALSSDFGPESLRRKS